MVVRWPGAPSPCIKPVQHLVDQGRGDLGLAPLLGLLSVEHGAQIVVQLGQKRVARLQRVEGAQRAALEHQVRRRYLAAAGDLAVTHAHDRMPGERGSAGQQARFVRRERRCLDGRRECDLVRARGERAGRKGA